MVTLGHPPSGKELCELKTDWCGIFSWVCHPSVCNQCMYLCLTRKSHMTLGIWGGQSVCLELDRILLEIHLSLGSPNSRTKLKTTKHLALGNGLRCASKSVL